jgi:hypothetical protein
MSFRMHPLRWLVLVFLLPLFSDPVQAQPTRREFPAGTLRAIEDLPASRLRTQFEHLPGPARARALSGYKGFISPQKNPKLELYADSMRGMSLLR